MNSDPKTNRSKPQDVSAQVQKLKHDLQRILGIRMETPHLDFFISSLTEYNPFNSTEEVIQWLQNLRNRGEVQVNLMPLSDLRRWYFDPHTGDLEHETGGFFAIRGLEVHTNVGPVRKWSQPIIDQPKIGLLGFICKKINDILYLLIQAKAEPGNLHSYQIAPTVQAMRSNFCRLHGGRNPPFIEYFLDPSRARVIFDQHQSEQGARFFRKRNRNVIVQIGEEERIGCGENFRWVTLRQLKRLMRLDNFVNMDARSVVSTICFCPEDKIPIGPIRVEELRDCLESSPLTVKPVPPLSLKLLLSACSEVAPVHSMEALLRILSREKFQAELDAKLIPLKNVENWIRGSDAIVHERRLYFSVIGVRVEADHREVRQWDQPIVRQQDSGIVGFIMKDIEGILHFLVQLKVESGNIDLLGMAPTVQCITGSYRTGTLPPFVREMVSPQHSQVLFDTMQSEEGGRFYQEENRNLLLLADDPFPLEVPPRYLWVSLRQLKQFITFNNFLNVESRSLLAAL